MKGKEKRHKAIKEIILNNEIGSQDMLLNLLVDNGFTLTQATLSRDMKELMIAKAPTSNGTYIYRISNRANSEAEVALSTFGFESLQFSGNLAVIKTRPGYAMGIAGEIDQKATSHILGTVAGDDTILLILKENVKREDVTSLLSQFIPNLK